MRKNKEKLQAISRTDVMRFKSKCLSKMPFYRGITCMPQARRGLVALICVWVSSFTQTACHRDTPGRLIVEAEVDGLFELYRVVSAEEPYQHLSESQGHFNRDGFKAWDVFSSRRMFERICRSSSRSYHEIACLSDQLSSAAAYRRKVLLFNVIDAIVLAIVRTWSINLTSWFSQCRKNSRRALTD